MQKETKNPIGQVIKSIRKAKNLTQADFAGIGISPTYLSLIENGHRRPPATALVKIARILEVDISELDGQAQDEFTPALRDLIFTTQLAINGNHLSKAVNLLDQFPADFKNSTAFLLLQASLDCELGSFLAAQELVGKLITERFESATLSQKMELVTLYGETSDKSGLGVMAIFELFRIQDKTKSSPAHLRILLGCLLAARLDDAGFHAEALKQLKAAEGLLGTKPDADLERNIYWTASNMALNAGDFDSATDLAKSAIRTLPNNTRPVNNLQIGLLEIELSRPGATTEELTRGLERVRSFLREAVRDANGSNYIPKLRILEINFLLKLKKFEEAGLITGEADTSTNMAASDFSILQIQKAEIALNLKDPEACRESCVLAANLLKAQVRNKRNEELWNWLKKICLEFEGPELLHLVTSLEISQESQFDYITK